MTQENQIPNRVAFDSWKVVGPFQRVLGFLVDSVITAILSFLAVWLYGRHVTPTQFIFLWILSMWAWEGFWFTLTGTSPGRRIFGISIYSPRNDGIPHPIQVCIRILTFWLSFVLLFTGLTPILFRRDRRGWHDLLSETLTVGSEKQVPTAYSQKVGQILQLVQSLLVFSTIGALLLSSGTGHFASLSGNINQVRCDNPELLLKKTPEVLAALTLSPSWSECWSRLNVSLGPVSDSQLGRLGYIAAMYFALWTHSDAYRTEFYAEEIKIREDALCQGQPNYEEVCKTARSLASVTEGAEIETAQTGWLGRYEDLARNISRETKAQRRVEYLKSALAKYKDPIVQSALHQRLWAEELSLGQVPSIKLPEGVNSAWETQQQCWLYALGMAGDSCSVRDLKEGVQIIDSLIGGADLKDIKDKLSRLELGEYESEFEPILTYFEAKQSGQPELINFAYSRISYISPLRSIASKINP